MPETAADAIAAFAATPMSRKAAMLAVLLLDREIGQRSTTGGDILAHRAAIAACCPALALVMQLAAMSEDGPRLVLEPVPVSAEAYPHLSEADYMVSLYNGATLPQVLVARPDGSRRNALELLRTAAAELT